MQSKILKYNEDERKLPGGFFIVKTSSQSCQNNQCNANLWYPNRKAKSTIPQNMITYGHPRAWTIMSVANDPIVLIKIGVLNARMSMDITSPALTHERRKNCLTTKRTHQLQEAGSDTFPFSSKVGSPAMGFPAP
mmetsp:Transcript_22318/g.43153  ORF Transcript_22318/g.43153 Transcript_22318/m.43153 type:complete len:135 (-) Transcript_22318:54-458(-)